MIDEACEEWERWVGAEDVEETLENLDTSTGPGRPGGALPPAKRARGERRRRKGPPLNLPPLEIAAPALHRFISALARREPGLRELIRHTVTAQCGPDPRFIWYDCELGDDGGSATGAPLLPFKTPERAQRAWFEWAATMGAVICTDKNGAVEAALTRANVDLLLTAPFQQRVVRRQCHAARCPMMSGSRCDKRLWEGRSMLCGKMLCGDHGNGVRVFTTPPGESDYVEYGWVSPALMCIECPKLGPELPRGWGMSSLERKCALRNVAAGRLTPHPGPEPTEAQRARYEQGCIDHTHPVMRCVDHLGEFDESDFDDSVADSAFTVCEKCADENDAQNSAAEGHYYITGLMCSGHAKRCTKIVVDIDDDELENSGLHTYKEIAQERVGLACNLRLCPTCFDDHICGERYQDIF